MRSELETSPTSKHAESISLFIRYVNIYFSLFLRGHIFPLFPPASPCIPASAILWEQLPLPPSRVILLVPEDRGAHRQESKAHSRGNAAFRHRGSPCHAWTSKAGAANEEATCGT